MDVTIVVPEDLPRSSARRWIARVVVALFCAVIALTGLVDALHPLPKPTLLGREADDDARMRANANVVDGSRMRLFERDFQVRSRVRAAIASPWTWLLYRGFGDVPKDVIVGRDGWLYYATWNVAPPRSTEQLAGLGAATLAALERRLVDHELRLVVAPIPRKSVLYPEYLPEGLDIRPAIEPAFVRELEQRGVAAADLPSAMAQHRDLLLYGKRAYHWANDAQRIAAEELSRRAGLLVEPDERDTQLLSAEPITPEPGLLQRIGLALDAALEIASDQQEPTYQVVHDNGVPAAQHPRLANCRVAVVGSSFVAMSSLAPYLRHYAGVPAWDAGLGGIDPVLALEKYLDANPRKTLPSWVFLETHIATLFLDPPYPTAPGLCVQLEPNGTSELPAGAAIRVADAFAAGNAVALDENRVPLARVPRGGLGHSGDGVAAIEIEGEVEGATLEIELTTGGVKFHATWDAERHRLVLPLLAAHASDDEVLLTVKCESDGTRASLKLASARVVVPVELDSAVDLALEPPSAGDSGWSQRLALAEPATLGEQAALVIELGVEGAFDGSLSIVLPGSDAPPAHFAALERSAVLVLNLDGLAGASLAEIRIDGDRAAPASLARRASLARPFEPGDDPRAKKRRRR